MKNHSCKILVFIINILALIVGVLLIKGYEDEKKIAEDGESPGNFSQTDVDFSSGQKDEKESPAQSVQTAPSNPVQIPKTKTS